MFTPSNCVQFVCAVLYLFTVAGCGQVEPIRLYHVDRPVPPDRMLGAIIPDDEMAWFFKVSGPNQVLDELTETFFEFIGTVRIGDGKPTWSLPDGWVRGPGGGMRYATIRIDSSDGPLELSVTSLPKMADESQLLLDNINRWRGQLKLPPLSPDRLSAESVKRELNASSGLTATLVNMVGTLTAGGMGPAPFASGGSPPRGPMASPGRSRAVRKTISYDTPDGWETKERVSSRGGITIERDAVFGVVDGNAQIEITVTQLPSSSQVLAQNINRWRGEVDLESGSDSETEEIEVGGIQGVFLELLGSQRAILGVIAVDQGTGLFIKLKGDRDLALRERERFREFVNSIQFSNGE